jgi:hypothetical protein
VKGKCVGVRMVGFVIGLVYKKRVKMPITDPRAREKSGMGIPITDSRGTTFP